MPRRYTRRAGLTLIEVMVVVAIIALLSAIALPSFSNGLTALRLSTATGNVVTFLNTALNRAERQQVGVELIVSMEENRLVMRAANGLWADTLPMPEGVRIVRAHPPLPPGTVEKARIVLLHPGGTIPRIGVELAGAKGTNRVVRVDPIAGAPVVEEVQP